MKEEQQKICVQVPEWEQAQCEAQAACVWSGTE